MKANKISRSQVAVAVGVLLLLLISGCRPQMPRLPSSAVAAIMTSEVSPGAELSITPSPLLVTPNPQPEETATPETQLPLQLTLWTVEAVSPQAQGDAGAVFGTGLAAFESTHPGVQVSVVLRNDSGKGSASDYLRTANLAAPSILPDVVVLDVADLAPVARTGLVVPLDGLLPSALVDDLLPGARAAGTVDGQLIGIPFEMDVEHLIYNTNKVASTPVFWTDVISANTTYVFPAKGTNGLVSDAFLVQYLALGGRLWDEEGRPFLDRQALQAALAYYQQGVVEGAIPSEVLTIGSTDDIWPDYVAAEVGMAHTNGHRFLRNRDVLRSTEFANIPTRDGTPLTIGRGRALAIVTLDEDRQALALDLIEWLMAPDNNVAWSQATSFLPTRYAAFELIGDSDPYWPFLQNQLEVAVPAPAFPEYDQIGRVLQQAVIEVLSEEATPEEAAAAAVDAVTP